MRGFKPNTKNMQHYKDGGMIRGPGTGTSDSIPRGFKPGTFIMPADSTKAIGPEVLEKIAKVPTKVSNGEFAHTPQEVHAVGLNTLRQMKDATHTPAKGFNPAMYFANGGLVDEEKKRPNSFGDAAAVARNPGMTQAVPTATTPLGQMHNPSPRTAAQMLASGLDSGARAFFDSFGPSPEKPATTVAPTTPNPTDQRLAAGTQTAPSSMAAAALAPAAPEPTIAANPNNVTKTVGPDGRVSYSGGPNISGDITVNGKTPGGGFMVADSLASRALAQPAQAPQAQGVTAPNIQHSGNSWQAANDLRNARVSASSITANGGRFDQTRKGQISPQAATYAAMLGTDQALQQAQPGMAQAAMRENAGIQREGMQQEGATQRAGLGFQTAQQRLAMDQETQGFANRAAQQSEQLRNTLLDPNATPEQRKQAQETLLALSGKERGPRWKTSVVPGGVDALGNKLPGYGLLTDEASGESKIIQPGQGGAAQTQMPPPSARPVGSISTVGGKSARWDGQKWVPLG